MLIDKKNKKMIQIYNLPYSRTGNHIIQYLFGYILSNQKNYNLQTNPINGFSKIKNIDGNQTIVDNFLQTGFGTMNTDYSKLLNHNGGILINGYLQKYDYFKNHIESLKPLIIPDEKTDFIPGDNDLVMHIRLTDYCINNNNVPFEIYDSFIKNNNDSFDNFIIVTDEPKSDFIVKILENNKTKLVHQNMYKDFDLLRIARKTFISQSSYSWVATYFGESEEIYVPLSNGRGRYLWIENPIDDDIKLIDKNDKRYKIITY